MNHRADIAIVGGGLVGLSLAASLGRTPLKTIMLEKQVGSIAEISPLDARTTGLAISSVRFFQSIGLWSTLAPHATAIHVLHITEQGNFGVARVEQDASADEPIGYMVPNQELLNALGGHVSQLDQVCIMNNFELSGLCAKEDGYLLTGKQQNEQPLQVHGRLMAACDGAGSMVRQLLGIGFQRKDYKQTAIISNIQVGSPQAHTAFERFTAHGPLAVLPIGGDRYALVWTLARDQVKGYLDMTDDHFIAALQAAFGQRLGVIEAVGQRVSYPLSLVVADQLVAWRSVLLGNAAQALHPVAAQGFNLGLRDVQALTTLLQREQFELANVEPVLRNYACARKVDRDRTVKLTDGLTRIFRAQGKIPRVLRSACITGLGSSSLLQSIFLQGNMGISQLLAE